MKRGLGIRPAASEKHLSDARVRTWVLDTSGVRRLDGQPLKRHRWEVTGVPRSTAIAIREHRIARLMQGLPAIDVESEERFFKREEPPAPEPKKPAPPSVCENHIAPMPASVDATPLLKAYVEERYLPWARTHKAAGTVINKERIHSKHLLPQLGALSLAQAATPEALQAFSEYLTKTKESRTGAPLATGYKNKILAEVSAIFTHASHVRTCRPPLIQPVQVELFKERRSRVIDSSGMEVGHLRDKALSTESVFRLLEAARNSARHPTLKSYSSAYWYVLIGLGLYAGCRVGESCGRRWCDVDLDAGTIVIASKVSSETDEFEGHTKNFLGGIRKLAPAMLDALRRLHAETNPKDGDFVLGARSTRLSRTRDSDGKAWLSTKNLRDRYAVLTEVAFGKETRNYHALRHTYATTLADQGVPIAQIQVAMRHSQIKQTMGYVHPRSSAVDEATAAIDYSPKLKVIPGGKKGGVA